MKEQDYKEIYNELLNLRNSTDVLEFIKTQSYLITKELLQYIDQQPGMLKKDQKAEYDYLDLDDPESPTTELEWKGYIRNSVKDEVEFKTAFDIKETDPNKKNQITWRADPGDPDYTDEFTETLLEDEGKYPLKNYPPGMSESDLNHVGEIDSEIKSITDDILGLKKSPTKNNRGLSL